MLDAEFKTIKLVIQGQVNRKWPPNHTIKVTERSPTCCVWIYVTSSLRTESRPTRLLVISPPQQRLSNSMSQSPKVALASSSSSGNPKSGSFERLINLPACHSAELRGKSSSTATVGLAAAGGNSLHMFVIRGKRKKSGKEEEEEEGGGDVGDVAARCGCRCGEKPLGGAVRPLRGPNNICFRQTDRQADS